MGEELDESLLLPRHATDHVCADCGEAIHYMDEVYLLQVVRPYALHGQITHYQVFDEEEVTGAFRFEPWFFCIPCWEQLRDSVQADMADELPVVDEASRFECACCGSGIREMELAGVAAMGEFHVSARAPNGVRASEFVFISNSDMLCLYCLVVINDGYIDMWPDLAEHTECTDCIQMRCWRERQCACRCHLDLPEEEEEPRTPQALA